MHEQSGAAGRRSTISAAEQDDGLSPQDAYAIETLPRVALLQKPTFKPKPPAGKKTLSPDALRRAAVTAKECTERLYIQDRRRRLKAEKKLHERYDFKRQQPMANPLPRSYRKQRASKKQDENSLLAPQQKQQDEKSEDAVGPSRTPMEFTKWDSRYFKITEGGRTLQSASKWSFTPALCGDHLVSGKHTWAVSVSGPNVLLGVTNAKPRGYHGIDRKSWCYNGATGSVRHEGFSLAYGPPLKQHDVVSIELDLTDDGNNTNSGTIEFIVNGQRFDIAFQDLHRHTPLLAMVDVWNHGSVTMLSHTVEEQASTG
eukprot:TRINITY_DN4122_c0_g1_i1.p1 TRINITY_DN4122_c0_g1~~TRINITY_DN4122_c0_g1_i1.p1  ORF type:complete len:314 (-),score=40.78 TRINITY_DN4122_c0_g1_i1:91-1032(-)